MFKKWANDWGLLHPGWDMMLWHEQDVSRALLGNPVWQLWEDAARISSNVHQYRSDLLRYALLNLVGGVWLDMDMEPHRNLGPLLDGHTFVAVWEVPDEWVTNAFLASVPGHPVLKAIIDALPTGALLPGSNTVKSGPQFITPFVAEDTGVHIAPTETFFPFRWDELDKRGSAMGIYGTHHYNNKSSREKARWHEQV